MKIKSKFVPDTLNANGKIYTKKAMKSALDKYNEELEHNAKLIAKELAMDIDQEIINMILKNNA